MSRTTHGGLTVPDQSLGNFVSMTQAMAGDAAGLIAGVCSLVLSGSGDYAVGGVDPEDVRKILPVCTGGLSGTKDLVYPLAEAARVIIVFNKTTGGHSVRVRRAGQSSNISGVAANNARLFFHDGTDWYGGPEWTPSSGALVGGGGGSGYATVQDDGSNLTQRAIINFVGAAVQAADDAGGGRTNVNFATMLNLLAALSDPNANRFLYWNDTTNAPEWGTFGAGLTLSGGTLSASGSPALKAVRLTRTSNYVVGSGVEVEIPWQSEVKDTDGFWASSPNPERIIFSTAGIGTYIFVLGVKWTLTATTSPELKLRQNDTFYPLEINNISVGNGQTQLLTFMVEVTNTTDYLEAAVVQSSGMNQTLDAYRGMPFIFGWKIG